MSETRILIGLAVAVLLEVGAWRLGHRTDEEVRALVESPSVTERISAIHVLTNRNEPAPLERGFVGKLLRAEDSRLREMAMTTSITRLSGKAMQAMHVRSARDAAVADRLDFFLNHQGFGGENVARDDFERFFRSLATSAE